MDCQKVGNLILQLRKEKNMTQKQLADTMNISDKTISKWERGLGCPDISILSDLSNILGIDIEKILLGDLNPNDFIGGNMKKVKFYVCPECNNVITSTGNATVSCCGRKLDELVATKADESHILQVEIIEDDWYISNQHEMTREHYISFIAFVTGEKLYLLKQYPEWGLETRIQKRGRGKLYSFCTKHGLYYQLI